MFILCVCVFGLHVFIMCIIWIPDAHSARRGQWIPWNSGATDHCELHCGCWDLNPGSLQEQPVLFILRVWVLGLHIVCASHVSWCQQKPGEDVWLSHLSSSPWLLLELLHFPLNGNDQRLMLQMVQHWDSFGHVTYCSVFLIFVMQSIEPAQSSLQGWCVKCSWGLYRELVIDDELENSNQNSSWTEFLPEGLQRISLHIPFFS